MFVARSSQFVCAVFHLCEQIWPHKMTDVNDKKKGHKNPYIPKEDVLYHVGLSSGSQDLKAMFGDIKVCTNFRNHPEIAMLSWWVFGPLYIWTLFPSANQDAIRQKSVNSSVKQTIVARRDNPIRVHTCRQRPLLLLPYIELKLLLPRSGQSIETSLFTDIIMIIYLPTYYWF